MKITYTAALPKGFAASGLAAGIKKNGKLDLGLFYSRVPAATACLSTANTMPAAPVVLNRASLKKGGAFRAIIANSGNANAFTGSQGMKDAVKMAAAAAGCLGIASGEVLVASTGIIGKCLPVEKITLAAPALCAGLSAKGISLAKRAIMTTDKLSKEVTVAFSLEGKPVTLTAVAKGAGMISPKMATMFAFVFTDAAVSKQALDKALRAAAEASFNRITVDGCMSTNDTLICMANGCAGNRTVTGGKGLAMLTRALETACLYLAKRMVQDGEGSTKVVTITVEKARSAGEARSVALAVANSNLFKTAMFASSANILGRAVAAVGSTGVAVREKDLKILYTPLKKKEVGIRIRLGRGTASYTVYTSDLSYEYVKINAQYN